MRVVIGYPLISFVCSFGCIVRPLFFLLAVVTSPFLSFPSLRHHFEFLPPSLSVSSPFIHPGSHPSFYVAPSTTLNSFVLTPATHRVYPSPASIHLEPSPSFRPFSPYSTPSFDHLPPLSLSLFPPSFNSFSFPLLFLYFSLPVLLSSFISFCLYTDPSLPFSSSLHLSILP